jgi:drug/metabolite transporter (DMT)-like permease
VIVSLVCAIGSALAYGASTLMQAVATRRAHGLAAVMTPLVIGAFVVDGLGFVLSLLALDNLPLFVVQSIMASMLVVVVIGARFLLHAHMRRLDVVAVVVVIAALILIGLGSGEQPAVEPPASFERAMLIATGVLVVVALALYRTGPGWLLAAIAGLGFSGAAIAARASHHHDGIWETVWQPMTACIVVCGIIGALWYLRALERLAVGPSAAILSVIEVVVPGAVGVLVLGDTIANGMLPGVLIGLVLAISGCVVLAMSPANEAAEGEPAPKVEPAPA